MILYNTDTYDLVISVGGLLPHHIEPDAFDEIIRITKPGRYAETKISANKPTLPAPTQWAHSIALTLP